MFSDYIFSSILWPGFSEHKQPFARFVHCSSSLQFIFNDLHQLWCNLFLFLMSHSLHSHCLSYPERRQTRYLCTDLTLTRDSTESNVELKPFLLTRCGPPQRSRREEQRHTTRWDAVWALLTNMRLCALTLFIFCSSSPWLQTEEPVSHPDSGTDRPERGERQVGWQEVDFEKKQFFTILHSNLYSYHYATECSISDCLSLVLTGLY